MCPWTAIFINKKREKSLRIPVRVKLLNLKNRRSNQSHSNQKWFQMWKYRIFVTKFMFVQLLSFTVSIL